MKKIDQFSDVADEDDIGEVGINVVPWPDYDAFGGGPFWRVRVQGDAVRVNLSWAQHLGRFVESKEWLRLRMKSPSAYRAALSLMRGFVKQGGISGAAEAKA